jgi:hypothetical protein
MIHDEHISLESATNGRGSGSQNSPRHPQCLPASLVTDDDPEKGTDRNRIEEERKGKKRK